MQNEIVTTVRVFNRLQRFGAQEQRAGDKRKKPGAGRGFQLLLSVRSGVSFRH